MWMQQVMHATLAWLKPSFSRSITLLALMSVLTACGKPPIREIARIQSPDAVVDAVLAERAVGATVATPSEVYIVPHGGGIKGEPLLRADNMRDLKLAWKQPRFLEMHYSKGRIFSFTNFWESADVQNWKYVVELRLVPATDGYSLN
jgi:hypothetical protein